MAFQKNIPALIASSYVHKARFSQQDFQGIHFYQIMPAYIDAAKD
jgi:hypothetical protein